MIVLKKVEKNFGENKAVDGISLTIKPGEIVGLLGPNGAGKTTTLRMLAGVLPPTKGTITIDGKGFDETEQTLKGRIGYLPEENPLYDDLTVEEHLKFWASMKHLGVEETAEAIEFAIEKTGIREVYYRLIGELSKGYRQRVGLAQAILARPDILLLDEPTEGLDPNQRRDIQTLLSDLKVSRTVIVSSHVLSEITKIASRIIIISQGQVVGDDSPDNLVKEEGGKQTVEVEIEGTGVVSGIKSLKNIEEVVKEKTNYYQVTSDSKKDIRPEIFNLAVKKKWVILTMKLVERKLEDVFSELTE